MHSFEVDVLDSIHLLSCFENRARHSQVLYCDSGAVEDGDLSIGNSAGYFSKEITASLPIACVLHLDRFVIQLNFT